MADLSWGEVVGGGIAGVLTGIGGTWKALRAKTNGNGHVDRKELGALKDVVTGLTYAQRATEANVARLETTLARHDVKLDDIREDLSKIMAAVDRRND